MASLQNLLTKLNLKVVEGTLGQNNKIITKLLGNEFWKPELNSIIKANGGEFSAKYKQADMYWFWWGDKNSNLQKIKQTLEGIIKKSNEMTSGSDISPDELITIIDDIINTINTESPSSTPEIGVTKQDEDNIKKRLYDFKQMLTNIENDEEFKKIMSQIIAIKGAQGYEFSLKNAILIYIQNRNAGIVNNRSNWLSKYNRTVNDKATPLLVYAPQGQKIFKSKEEKEKIRNEFLSKLGKKSYGELTPNEKIRLDKILNDSIIASRFILVPVYSQYDTTQIEGKEDFIKKASETQKDIKWFEENMISEDVRPIYKGLIDFGESNNLKIELVDTLDGARGVSKGGLIQILKNNGNDVGLTKTLAHEITHELLHQKYLKLSGNKLGKYKIDKMLDMGTIEQQAELSAWMFMHAFGFDLKTTSLNYTVMWGGNKENMIVVFDTVVSVVNELIKHVNSKMGALTEENKTNGNLYTPDDVAKLLGVNSEYNKLKQQELKERILKKLNII